MSTLNRASFVPPARWAAAGRPRPARGTKKPAGRPARSQARVRVKPRRAYHHKDLRQSLVAGAETLLAAQGPQRLTLRAVARAAGVSPAAPYRHFADKQSLLAAVAAAGFRRLAQTLEQAAQGAPADDPVGRFHRLGRAYVHWALGSPASYRLIFGPEQFPSGQFPEYDQAAAAAFGRLTDALALCQQRGLAADGEVRTLAITAWSLVHGLSLLLVDGQLGQLSRAEAERLAAQVAELLYNGLRGAAPEHRLT